MSKNFEVKLASELGRIGDDGSFSGTAYSGKPLNYRGNKIVIDLSSLELRAPIPTLMDHDPSKRTGFVSASSIDNGILISGKLLDNDYGKMIKAESDQGFPWQLSVFAESENVEFVKNGEIKVNGLPFSNGYVMKNAIIREVSFTPVGVDKDTSVVFFNKELVVDDKLNEVNLKLEAALAAIDELKAEKQSALDRLSAANAKLEEQKTEQRKAILSGLLPADVVESRVSLYAKLSDDSFSAVVADMQAMKQAQAQAKDTSSDLENELRLSAGSEQVSDFSKTWSEWPDQYKGV